MNLVDKAIVLEETFELHTTENEFFVTQRADDESSTIVDQKSFKTEREARAYFLYRIVQFVACFHLDEEISTEEMTKIILAHE